MTACRAGPGLPASHNAAEQALVAQSIARIFMKSVQVR
jgi:hypothetical protein